MLSFRLLNVILTISVATLIYTTGCTYENTDNNIKEPVSMEDNTQKEDTDLDIKNPEDDKVDSSPNNNDYVSGSGIDAVIKDDYLDENNVVTNYDAIDVVVNKKRNLPSDYAPKDLVKLTDVPTCLQNPEVNQLRKEAAQALTEMFDEAKKDNVILVARSGYRSYNTQVSLYDSYVRNHGEQEADKFSAKPGQSEHQTGLAIDVTADSVNLKLTESFADTTEGKWVAENAHKYGFILRYKKGSEDITGYMFEPWHIRYVGKDLASKVYESGQTLEEYMFGE